MPSARILVMDEPTTPLSSRETDRLFELIRQLRAEGLAIIYISHRMAEIYELSDRVSVLRDGGYVGTLERADLSAESLVKMMVGRDISGFYKKEHAPYDPGKVVLRCATSPTAAACSGCSLDLHAGEVLGIAGLVGAGRTELARLIFGAEPRTRGEVTVDGKTLDTAHAARCDRCGRRLPDRRPQGPGPVSRHERARQHQRRRVGRDARLGVLDLARGAARARDAITALTIRVPSAKVNAGALSGGNQQKVLLSRLLETKPRVLILDEPTRGVDIGAKSEIYRIINELAQIRRRHHRHLERTAGGHRHRRPRRWSCVKANSPASSAATPARRSRRKPSSNWPRARARRWAKPLDPYETHESRRSRISGGRHEQSIKPGRRTVAAGERQAQRQSRIEHTERMQSLMRTAGMLPVLILLCIGFGVATDRFFSLQNLSIVTQQASINVVLAAGMTFVILTGGIDLSVGSVLVGRRGGGLAGVEHSRLRLARHAGRARGRAGVRPDQRRADRAAPAAAVHRHARLADRGARHRAAARPRHDHLQPATVVRLHRQRHRCSAFPGS